MRKILAALALLALLAPASGAPSDEELSEAARARLETEKVLVGTREFWSVSSAYKGGEHPYLLTSDAVIFALHSLLRETVARLEWARGAALRRALAAMEGRLPEARERFDLGETLSAADRRARIVLATARQLLGDEPREAAGEILSAALAEAARVESASYVVELPEWYGPPDAGFAAVDYTRFRPVGILAEIPETARIFRAAAWLAFVPFRLDRDEELAAFLLLAAATEGVPEAAVAFGALPELLGPGDDPCLADVPELPGRVERKHFPRLRAALARAAGPGRVRDLPALPGSPQRISARVLPLAAPDDAALLQRISDRRFRSGEEGPPTALAVAVALGSPLAAARLPAGDREVVAAFEGFAGGESVHDRFLRCMAHLLGPPPEGAPAVFGSPAWRAKSLQTVMAGYTYWRHAFDLRIKDGARYLGAARCPAGFVEPAPVFFRAFGRVVRETGALLSRHGVDEVDYGRVVAAAALEAAAEIVSRVPVAGEGVEGEKAYWERVWPEVEKVPVLHRMGDDGLGIFWYGLKEVLGDKRAPTTEEERIRCVKALRAFAEKVRSGESDSGYEPRERKRFTESFGDLAALADRMAGLAERQLRGMEPSEEDEAFVRGFGHRIGRILGEGDHPSDDAPVAVGVFADPARGRHLVEGVGRPRALYVLYPVGEYEVVCRGVAIPWYEASLPRVPTDAEWKALLDSDARPALPEAVRGIYLD
jgi:hypothetical protein